MGSEQIDPEKLYGTWRLVASQATNAAGGPLPDPWGPAPMGRLVLDRRGRMMSVLCDGRARMPEGESRAYSSYCGNFRLEGDMLITTVDAASDPSRIGREQRRHVDFDGERLVLSPPAGPDGEQRKITWDLEAPAPHQ
jgi:hypothetical protein